MKKLLLILTIIFINSAWTFDQSDYLDNKIYFPTDSLEGKNLICNWSGEEDRVFPDTIYAFKFIESSVEGYYLKIYKNVAEIFNWNTDIVSSISTNDVRWWSSWVLNRKSLKLIFRDTDIEYQCRVLPNLKAYEDEMEGYRKKLQKMIDDKISKETEKNKI